MRYCQGEMHKLFGINFWISNSVMVVWTRSGNGLYGSALPNGINKRSYRNIRHSILLQFYLSLHPITSSIHPSLQPLPRMESEPSSYWDFVQILSWDHRLFPSLLPAPPLSPPCHLAEDLEASTELPPFQKTFPDIYIPPPSSIFSPLLPEFEFPVYHLAQLSLCQIIRACLHLPYQISATERQKYSDMKH